MNVVLNGKLFEGKYFNHLRCHDVVDGGKNVEVKRRRNEIGNVCGENGGVLGIIYLCGGIVVPTALYYMELKQRMREQQRNESWLQ